MQYKVLTALHVNMESVSVTLGEHLIKKISPTHRRAGFVHLYPKAGEARSSNWSTEINIQCVCFFQVSDYLKKQMVPEDGSEVSEDIMKMLESHDKLVEEIFQHEDKDKNGFISHEEFSGPKHDEL